MQRERHTRSAKCHLDKMLSLEDLVGKATRHLTFAEKIISVLGTSTCRYCACFINCAVNNVIDQDCELIVSLAM